jgi:hypothetical protein
MELRVHEMLALLSCFILPLVGAWLLHAIRGQLSRPSEGLVSNYNLTVFLLASEIRPVSHLVKMIQARTLFLQRVVSVNPTEDEHRLDPGQAIDLVKRVGELEAHAADSVERSSDSAARAFAEVSAAKSSAHVVAETRKSLQPELDALNRAVRRYEKRTTISSLQTEARLQDLESRLTDVVVLAAAAQRNAEKTPKNFIVILLNWLCAIVVLPVQAAVFLSYVPSRIFKWATDLARSLFASKASRPARRVRPGNPLKSRERQFKIVS